MSAKHAVSTADGISAVIAEMEAEAYVGGQADARKEPLDVLGATEITAASARMRRGRHPVKAAPSRRAGGRKPVPRGSVPRFVEGVLR